MSFTFNNAVPEANNNPSDDQTEMLQNNVTHPKIWAVDHVAFNDNDAGKHLRVTFVTQNAAVAQVDPASTLYTGPGSASTNSQLLFRNADQIFPVSMVRAFGVFTGAGSVSATDNDFNVQSITGNTSTVTVELKSGAVTGNNVIIVTGNSAGSIPTAQFSNPNITISGNLAAGRKISFIVLQA